MSERALSDKMQRVLVTLLLASERGRYPATANEVGYALQLPRVSRRRGPAAGTMGAAQRVITPLVALERRGLVVTQRRRDGLSGTAFRLTEDGRRRAHALRATGVTPDKPGTLSATTDEES